MFQFFPIFKGKGRIAKLLFSEKILQCTNVEVRGRLGLRFKLPNLRDNIAFSLFLNGIYEPENIDLIAKALPQNSVLLDLGANIGSICIPVARLRADIKVIAVEASPRVFSYLKWNVEANKLSNRIFLINKALSNSDNEIVSFYSPVDAFGKGSLSPDFTKESETVSTITVDSLLKELNQFSIGFIKIDVEGYESLVFKGAKQLLAKADAPEVLFEFSSWAEELAKNIEVGDSQNILINLGYKLLDANNPAQLKSMVSSYKSGDHMLLASKTR